MGRFMRSEPQHGYVSREGIFLRPTPEHPGSLGVAISEAVEDAVTSPTRGIPSGSVLNHVLMHQTVIGLEAYKQMALAARLS